MKKIVLALLVLATVLVSLPQLFAAPGDLGNVVVHFKKWDSDYTDLGSHGWGEAGKWEAKATHDGLDEFGAKFVFNDLPEVAPENTDTFGFIAVKRPGGGEPDWNNGKYTGDIFIPKTIVKGGQTVHVYVVQGNANSSASDPRYFVADPAKYNMLLVYFDPSGSYEEKLGIHHWSGWDLPGAEWNAPLQVFTTGGNTATGSQVKVAMLSADPTEANLAPDAGFLIYFGEGDNSKKTGDVKLLNSLGYEAASTVEKPHVVGSTGFAYVYSNGNGYTGGENVFYGNANYDDFAFNAFSFRLLPLTVDSTSGAMSGTHAVKPTQIIVKTSAQVANPVAAEDVDTEAEETAAIAVVKGWWSVKEKTGEDTYAATGLTIDRVDFALNNTAVGDFVIVLAEATKLDITKEYALFFDDGVNTAQIAVSMDTEKPVITFPLLPESKIIEVAWGQPFNLADFPLYAATDNRDGDLTRKVFVPAGSNAILDTRVEADYTIMLQVEDDWGNVTTETFIFRVVKPSA